MEYLENIKNLKIKDLKEICDKYELPKYGNKATLIERITKKIENIEINKRHYQELLKSGEEIQDDEFERIIERFQSWLTCNNLKLTKESTLDFKELDIREIRSLFIKYDYTKSYLRNDKLIPTPQNKVEEFLEFFFEYLDKNWFLFDKNNDDEFFELCSNDQKKLKIYLEN